MVKGVGSNVEFGSYTDASQHTHSFFASRAFHVDVDIPNAVSTSLTGLIAPGHSVGTYIDASNNSHGFMSENGVTQTFDFPARPRPASRASTHPARSPATTPTPAATMPSSAGSRRA